MNNVYRLFNRAIGRERGARTVGSRAARHRKGQWGRRAFQVTAVTAVTAMISTGALAAVAAPADLSQASARFLSGTLLTSAGTLDSIAALHGSSATNNGSAAPGTQTSSLDLSAILGGVTVDIPGRVRIPLSDFLKLGLVNQYAQASDNGVSRAGSGAVSDSGVVDLGGTGDFPADASIDLVQMLGDPATGVLDTANLKLGAATGVAALDAAEAGGPQPRVRICRAQTIAAAITLPTRP